MKTVTSTLSAIFFQFAGAHSFLIGLLPFFIPVLLLQQGISIQGIALFIALTGIGFIISLTLWKKFYRHSHWRLIISLSFLIELLLVAALLFTENNYALLLCAALLNGAYNCFYWTTQRVLFSAMTAEHKATQHASSYANQTGKKFGNFQILAVVLLKSGIICGAFLLEEDHRVLLLLVSAVISTACAVWFSRSGLIRNFSKASKLMPIEVSRSTPTKASVFHFKDEHNSAIIFYFDGIFLFLESYFWVASLFFIAQGSIKELGIVMVLLTVCLSVIFYLLKNRIDNIDHNKVYVCAVVFYALSWWLRSVLGADLSNYWIYPAILLIAFLTSFFRLSFNKRFFDHAKQHQPLNYLLAKSYLSQMGIVIFYIGLALLASSFSDSQSSLSTIYLVLTPMALIYLAYSCPAEPVSKKVSSAEPRLKIS